MGSSCTFRTNNGTFEAYISKAIRPASAPGLLLFSPIYGVDDATCDIADAWTARGFNVVAPDYFFRIRAGTLPRTPEGRKAAFERHILLDAAEAARDVQPALDYLNNLSGERHPVFSLGLCAGGELAFVEALNSQVAAAASFHATRIENYRAMLPKLKTMCTLHYGTADTLIAKADLDSLVQAASGCEFLDLHLYDGIGHGFSIPSNKNYDANSANAANASALALFVDQGADVPLNPEHGDGM